jgi:hypothetical protein
LSWILLSIQFPSTLPASVEITVSEIFLYYRLLAGDPTSYTDREWNIANPNEAPMVFLHASSPWRGTAIETTPVLWANMDSEWIARCTILQSVYVTKTWRILARGCASSLKFQERLSFWVGTRSLHPVVATRIGKDPRTQPGLRFLWLLSFASETDHRPSRRHTGRDEHCSSLRFISHLHPTLAWHQLTKFIGTRMLGHSFRMNVLRLCPNLTECIWGTYSYH